MQSTARCSMTSPRQLDDLLRTYIADFVARNRAAQALKKGLDKVGVGFSPSADHLTFRTGDVDRRAEEFLRLAYTFSERLEYEDWFAKVCRKLGDPALFIEPVYTGETGKPTLI